MTNDALNLSEALKHIAATLKLRHIDEATDEEVEEALEIARAALETEKAAPIVPAGVTTGDKQLEVENALLRGNLYLTASSLKNYHDAPHEPIDMDGVPMLQVTVSEVIRGKAQEALERADKMLRSGQ